jgi:DNA-binding Lrp family transcriptional regulator
MLVSMSDKELKRLSVLQEICDQRITQSQAAQLLHISERHIRRLLQKYKAPRCISPCRSWPNQQF